MSDFAIELQDVAVCYRVPLHPTLSLKQYAVQLLQRKAAARDCWALQALSLQVARGTALGVVGANGAGKSTLLAAAAAALGMLLLGWLVFTSQADQLTYRV